MKQPSQRLFRSAAIERLASPDQLDQLVGVTRPIDWIAALVMAAAIFLLVLWGFLGRVPTRVVGSGILIDEGGRIAEADVVAGGRLASIDVAVGAPVAQGQTVAHIEQPDLLAQYDLAVSLRQQRIREYDDLSAATERELRMRAAAATARRAGLEQAAAAATAQATTLAEEIRTQAAMIDQGLATLPDLQQLRFQLAAARQRVTDAHNEILTLQADSAIHDGKRRHELLEAQGGVDDARRQAAVLSERLARDTRIVSPISGRVVEIKASTGTVLAPGMPIVAIESARSRLRLRLYLPAETGKGVLPGMDARVEPATVQRDEFGTLVGRVESVSQYPETAEAMGAELHNPGLVAQLSRDGVLYGSVIALVPDPSTASGYRWSSGRGPPQQISSGTLARAEITIRERRPIDLIIPLVKRLGGGGS